MQIHPPATDRRSLYWLAFLILLKLALQLLLIHPDYQLHRDEFLHVDMGRHLAWGYVSVQPMIGLFSALILLMGGGETMVHLVPALLGAATVWAAWKTAGEFTDSIMAKVAAGLAVVLSPLLRINLLYQPNTFDLLCWTLGYWLLIRQIKKPTTAGFYRLALVAVAGLYCKYNFLFWLAGTGIAVLISPQRKWLAGKHLYAAAALALVALLPTLYWQYSHQFPLFRFLSELKSSQLGKLDRSVFWKEQLLFASTSLPVVLIAIYGLIAGRWRKSYGLAGWQLAVVMALFSWQQAKGYYAVGIYPFLFAAGYGYIANHFSSPRPWIIGLAVLNLINAVFLIHLAFPYRNPEVTARENSLQKSMGLLRWEDGKQHPLPQDYADMLGWRQMAALVDSACRNAQSPVLIKTDNYGQAGAVNFYSRCAAGKAVSFNADYRYWIDFAQQPTTTILVMTQYQPEEISSLRNELFGRIDSIGMVTDTLAREYGTVVYKFTEPKVHIGRLLRKEAAAEKGL